MMIRGAVRAALFAALSAHLGCADGLQQHRPAQIAPQHEPSGRLANVLKLRLYADQSHRAQIIGWKSHFERTLNRANRVLETDVGISFEIIAAEPWNRSEPIPDDLNDALYELARLDSGEGADLVVALVSAAPMFTPDLHQLGAARGFGKHVVLRGMDDLKEAADLQDEGVYEERVGHRETAVFLHEVGHIFGAIHFDRSDSFMAPRWSPDQARYDELNLEMLERVVGHRLRARGATALDEEAIADIRALLDEPRWADHDQKHRANIRAAIELGALADQVVHPHYAEARRLFEADRIEDAWNLVEQIRAESPPDPHLLELACAIAVRRSRVSVPDVDEACGAAINALSDRTGPMLNLVWAKIESKNYPEAHRALANMRAYCSGGRCDEDALGQLAQLNASFGLLTFAEEIARTATSARGAQEALERAKNIRKICGLDAGEQFPHEREDEYIRACHEITADLAKRDGKAALAAVERLRKIGETAGIHYFACQAHLVSFAISAAEAECRTSITLRPNVSEVHLLFGLTLSAGGKSQEAIRAIERARALDPAHEPSWTFLAREYQRTKQTAKLKALKAEFETTFGRPFPR